ncbi:glutaredoxin-3 [Nasonia vitripennis]|uniref:Thioredoxin domain-containing protein n=1 Tax=Nasonia vitripennis TaxID=7425 RepID=A0A7M7G807_NASVI|nr:glutaredoxin-3 [Nasonia vitripennis]
MPVVKLTSNDEYVNFLKSNDLSVIHFYAPWADQCTQMNEVLEQMTKLDEYKNVKFANIVAEDLPEISMKCSITAVPTTVLFNKENIVGRVNGANPSEVKEQIKKHLSNKNESSQTLEDKLQALIDKAPCMLFMKGNRDTPRCGFSRTIIALLEEHKADYETFDILEDNEVREGLKKYSNWPTYPQLYIRGELIGGLDIAREMSESGELDSMLPKKSQGNLEDRLKKLINQAPCMLFMKGNRDVPRCGFSRTIINLLNEHKADYQTFDILEDNEVREGLKKYSKWPTYPQLYINGELIGGLDIVKEMSEAGELDSMLPKKEA